MIMAPFRYRTLILLGVLVVLALSLAACGV
jgi:hypothetical protein